MDERAIVGINRDLFTWACDSRLYETAVGAFDPEKKELAHALGPNETKRYQSSFNLIKAIWHEHPELGLAPDYKLLSDKEFNRQYYYKYRDHLTHMFKVFLLGLYIYEKNFKIQQSVESVLPGEEAFLSIWIIAALYHDVGYVIETEDGCWDSEAGKTVISRFNDALGQPLTHLYPEEFGIGTEKASQESIGITPRQATGQVSIEKMLNEFNDYGKEIKLTLNPNSNPIKEYYDYASRHHVGRVYYDHGIVSACMLLFMRNTICQYIQNTKEQGMQLYDNQIQKRDSFLEQVSRVNEYVQHAAIAIALHNIHKDWHTEGLQELAQRGVTISEFYIPMEQEPIAYLLRLCDELQCWDRQYFSSPLGEKIEQPFEANRMNMNSGTGSLSVSIMDDNIKKKIESALKGILSPEYPYIIDIL